MMERQRCVVCAPEFEGTGCKGPEADACRHCYNARIEERDAVRGLACRLFRMLPPLEQLYGNGPQIVAANPWMLQEGPWQALSAADPSDENC